MTSVSMERAGGATTRLVREGEPHTPVLELSLPSAALSQTLSGFFRPAMTFAGVWKRGVLSSGFTVMTAGSLTRHFSTPRANSRVQTAQLRDGGDERQAQKARRDRPRLGGLGVGRAVAEDEQVRSAQLFRGHGQGVARGKGVRPAEGVVAQQHHVVAAHEERAVQDLRSLRRTHGDGRYLAAVLVPQAQARLDGVLVHGVYDALDALAQEVAVLVQPHLVGVGDLLYKNYDVHPAVLPSHLTPTHLAIIFFCTSEVPSNISVSLASRYSFSMANSLL